jgi:hypothetical protein
MMTHKISQILLHRTNFLLQKSQKSFAVLNQILFSTNDCIGLGLKCMKPFDGCATSGPAGEAHSAPSDLQTEF